MILSGTGWGSLSTTLIRQTQSFSFFSETPLPQGFPGTARPPPFSLLLSPAISHPPETLTFPGLKPSQPATGSVQEAN